MSNSNFIPKFGTDGIRGKAEDFTPIFLAKVIKGLIDYAGDEIKVFLAGDTRESSEWILNDLATACETFGVEYSLAGVLPTPAIDYCFPRMGFDFAIDVTASHNPYTDNGIKIFEHLNNPEEGTTIKTQKLSLRGRTTIEAALASDLSFTPASLTIRENLNQEALDLYLEHLKSYLGTVDFSGLHLGMDCANGATSIVNQTVFTSLGAQVELINCCKNYNTIINKDCGSTHLEPLQKLVLDHHLDFAVAFDGDGDRCLAVDEHGEFVDGDQMLAIFAQYFGLSAIVTTVMANQGLLNWATDHNIHAEITAVGDSNVFATMQEKGIDVGSEQSGHVILPDQTTGDGLLTALVLTKVIAESKQSLSSLASVVKRFPQVILNLAATPAQKTALQTSASAKNLLLEYDKKLKSVAGRLLVRPSGTENLIRITMWGNDAAKIAALAEELKTKLGEIL